MLGFSSWMPGAWWYHLPNWASLGINTLGDENEEFCYGRVPFEMGLGPLRGWRML